MPIRKDIAAVAALLLTPAIALAQAQQPAAPTAQQQAARPAAACETDLQAFGQRMDEEGFWLSGARAGFGWSGVPYTGTGQAGTAAPAAAPGMVGGTGSAASGQPAAGGGAAAAAAPFAGMDWRVAPTQALRTLYAAGHVLAQNGSEQACQTVLQEAQGLYDAYTAELRQAGIEPGEVRSWRQGQLALAQPVTQHARGMRADAITGTDLRNPQDAYLGSVEDVVFDPRSGQIAYVIVGRGGFLGIGRDHVAVPWQQMRVTPSLDTFVLDIPESRMDSAPQVDRDAFATDEDYDRRRGEIDAYWAG